jgi:hypothetical protein
MQKPRRIDRVIGRDPSLRWRSRANQQGPHLLSITELHDNLQSSVVPAEAGT